VKEWWSKLGAGAGILFVAWLVLAQIVIPMRPSGSPPGQQIIDFFNQHRQAMLLNGYLNAISVLLFLWFASTIRRRLGAAEGGWVTITEISFGAAVVTVALALAAVSVDEALAYRVPHDPAVAEALDTIGGGMGLVTGFPIAAFVAAASTAIVRTGAFARWLGLLGLIVAALQLLGTLPLIVQSGPLGASGAVGLASILALLLWILALAIAMLVPGRQTSPTAR
jgi:hypothetical protein